MDVHDATCFSFATLTLLTALAHSVPAHAADPVCKPVFDAQAKQAATPNHQYMTDTGVTHAQPSKGEIIVTGTAMYINVGSAWQRRDFSAQKSIAELREAAQTSHTTCKYLRDEAIGGEDAALYDTSDKQEDGTVVDSKIWISKSRGLPVKQTIDIDVGGKFGKSHSDVRIAYTNVQPPAGAK